MRIGYMQTFCKELVQAGVNTITLDDITGTVPARCYKYCVGKVREAVPDAQLGIHVHNDFALALPGVLGALEAGAEVLDCGVNAYGERAGHCDLAQLAAILEFLYGFDTGIKLAQADRNRQAGCGHHETAHAPTVADNRRQRVFAPCGLALAAPGISRSVAALLPEVVIRQGRFSAIRSGLTVSR